MSAKLKNVRDLAVGDVIQVPDQLAAHGTTHGRVEAITPTLTERPGYMDITLSTAADPAARIKVHLKGDGVVPVD